MLARFLPLLTLAFLAPLSSLTVSAAETDLNTLTSEEQQAGWKLLFDGKSMDHWRNYKKTDLSDKWKVVAGAITLTAKGGGDIVTREKYAAFELKLEYRISKAGNSGLMYHVTEDNPAPWQSGPEIQVQDNKDGHDPQKAGWLYQLYPAEVDATKPVGEWNEIHIVITPEKCEQYMNGVKYCEYVKGSEDWNMRVAKSKFGKMPNFGKATEGYICLQDHGDEVAYRNIKIRPIPAK